MKGGTTMDVINTRDASATMPQAGAPLADRLIRDLVDAYPETLTVLGPLGIDLCCGGGHPLGEALDLHGIDRGIVLPRIARIIAGSSSSEE
jgi:iron-sulfur cluster repair protein YtfE (RIC family)